MRREKSAFQAQSKLLEHFLILAHSSVEERVLHSILKKTIQISVDLTGAEKGSLFLLDSAGQVVDSILTRGERSPAEKAVIVGDVMDRGLAAWVRKHRRVGLVFDTGEDERWLNLPNQPYTVRSALAVPIKQGPDLLGLLTLLHSSPNHFSQETAGLMELTATLLGVALENARLYAKLQKYSRALDAEIEKAKKIQQQFLPSALPQLPGWDIAATFHPARRVSGDFYDAFMLPGKRLCVVIGDVCDKGVGSALFMALIRSLIRVFSGQTELEGVDLASKTGAAECLPVEACESTDTAALDAVSLADAIPIGVGPADFLKERQPSGAAVPFFPPVAGQPQHGLALGLVQEGILDPHVHLIQRMDQCLEAGKGEKVCMAELQVACKGLAIGKYCGMRHAH